MSKTSYVTRIIQLLSILSLFFLYTFFVSGFLTEMSRGEVLKYQVNGILMQYINTVIPYLYVVPYFALLYISTYKMKAEIASGYAYVLTRKQSIREWLMKMDAGICFHVFVNMLAGVVGIWIANFMKYKKLL